MVSLVAMHLSAEFVNNLVAVLNVLASQVATALDTLNFALMTERGRPTDTVVTPRAPRNSRHGLTAGHVIYLVHTGLVPA